MSYIGVRGRTNLSSTRVGCKQFSPHQWRHVTNSKSVLLDNNKFQIKRFSSNSPTPNTPAVPPLEPANPVVQIRDSNGAIWISNTYKLGRWTNVVRAWYYVRGKIEKFNQTVHKEISESFDELQFPGLRQVIPNFKDGGCYVTFASRDQAKQIVAALNHTVQVAGEYKRAFLVQGKPFIEDLSHYIPSPKIVVDLVDAAKATQRLSAELLFHEMRMYGKMKNIQVNDKKDSATILFYSTASAISARNCLHLKTIGDTKFSIRYEPYSQWLLIRDLLSNPRIYIPLLGILVSLGLYFLVPATRHTGVTQKLGRGFRDDHVLDADDEFFRAEMAGSLAHKLSTRPDSSITIITGPSGVGKSTLVNKVINRRAFSVRVDCRQAKKIEDFLEQLGEALGFWPSFTALSNFLSRLESFVPGMQKTALSPPTKAQFQKILATLDDVIAVYSSLYPSSKEKEFSYPTIVFDGFHELVDTLQNSADKDKALELVDLLLAWAAQTSKSAQIVFIGENTFGEELIVQNPHMKSCKLLIHHLSDLQEQTVVKYIQEKTELPEDSVSQVWKVIGGRISDMEAFVSKYLSGLPQQLVISDMVHEAENEIRNTGFGGKMLTVGSTGKKWTQVQLWKAIKLIVEKQAVRYDELLFSAFSGDNEAMKALVKEKLFLIQKQAGGVTYITAFSPLYFRAFEKLVKESPKLRKGLDILAQKADIQKDMEEMNKIEDELIKLRNAQEGVSNKEFLQALDKRRTQLSSQLTEVNSRLEKKENDLRAMEKS